MRCDGSPDPSVQQEINTFINLWCEDPEVQIKPILKECALALRVGLLLNTRVTLWRHETGEGDSTGSECVR